MVEDNFPSAKVICHSEAPNGEQLITLEIELHRFILPEFNTHRSFSRNFQSSRAVPIEKMIEQVRNNPAIPVHWGKNQRGMVAEQECNNLINCGFNFDEAGLTPEGYWKQFSRFAAGVAEDYAEAGYHKQIVNRLLEPFMRTKGVVTATKAAYEAFFKLRCHKDAQPEIKLLAERMQKAIAESKPRKLSYGEYHLPYVDDLSLTMSMYLRKSDLIKDKVKISSSCCGQVSYRALDDSLDKALKIYDMLNLPENGVYPEDPPHFSPTEHVAKVVENTLIEASWDGETTYYYPDQSGNFHSDVFWQYRKALEAGLEKYFYGEQNE